jgi:hypothetical protein
MQSLLTSETLDKAIFWMNAMRGGSNVEGDLG